MYKQPFQIAPLPNEKQAEIRRKIEEFTAIGYSEFSRKLGKDELEYLNSYLAGEIPETLPSTVLGKDSSSESFALRELVMKSGVFANITQEFAKEVAETLGEKAVLLDPMAGRGFLVKAFREAGLSVIGSDNGSWGLYDGIEELDAIEAMDKYKDVITHVVISWAPAGSRISTQIWEKARELGLTILHIGEGARGCTDDDEFHELYDPYEYFGSYKTYWFLHDTASLGF